jgi:hypothetical protein
MAVFRTAMIEAAVHEDGKLQRWNYKIRLAGQRANIPFDLSPPKDFFQDLEERLLRASPSTSDLGHDFAAFPGSEDVSHSSASRPQARPRWRPDKRQQAAGQPAR